MNSTIHYSTRFGSRNKLTWNRIGPIDQSVAMENALDMTMDDDVIDIIIDNGYNYDLIKGEMPVRFQNQLEKERP